MTGIKTDSNGKKYVIVEKNDNLWKIAEKHLGNGSKYTQLATWNKIPNPDYIQIGQKIYIEDPKLKDDDDPIRCIIRQFGLVSEDEKKLMASWTFTLSSKTEKYLVQWKFKNKGLITFEQYGLDGDTKYTYSTYDIPNNAKYVKFRVKPVPKETEDSNGKKTKLFTGETWSDWKQYNVVGTPVAPGVPDVELTDDLKLTARLDNLDYGEDQDSTIVYFEIVKDDTTTVKTLSSRITTGTASVETTVAAGGKYKVRSRAKSSDGIYSEWSQYSPNADTIPAKVPNFTKCEARSESSIYLEWAKADGAETYDIEYTQEKKNFDTNDQVSSVTGITNTYREVTGLTSGNEYFFRVKGVKGQKKSAEWSEVSSAIIGTGPAAPTTWSSTTTAIAGNNETAILYWVHNSEDESSQKFAEIELEVEGVTNIAEIANNVSVEIGTIDTTKTTITAIPDYAATYDTFSDWEQDVEFEVVDTSKIYFVNRNGVYYAYYYNQSKWIETTIADLIKNDDSYTKKYESYSEFEAVVTDVEKVYLVKHDGIYYLYYFGDGSWIRADAINSYRIFYHVDNTTDEKDKDKTHAFTIHTDKYIEGAKIRWRIRTAGITGVQGEEWSIQRSIDVYTKPIVLLSISDPNGAVSDEGLTSFPLKLVANVAGFSTNLQNPIGYHISVTVGSEGYETLDNVGNTTIINPGETIYSAYFDNPELTSLFELELTPSLVTLESGYSYYVNCTVSMSSGTTAETSIPFSVSWATRTYVPNAEVTIDTDTYTATIRPYCAKYTVKYYMVEYDFTEGAYQPTSELSDEYVYGESLSPARFLPTGEEVLRGIDADGDEVIFCKIVHETTYEDVTLAVYRREYDGSFTEIHSNIDGASFATIADPHPPLDYARYRIVARDNATGAICYSDTASVPVDVKSVIIQWDEDWVDFDATGQDDVEKPLYSGSLLVLTYNIDVSEKNDSDVALVNYIGRKHPVSYYGTHLGVSSSWGVEIPKSDKDAIYALRRLQSWMGDVYVREPSGLGYWATIKVSFNQKHTAVTVPVTIDVTRVEGGV